MSINLINIIKYMSGTMTLEGGSKSKRAVHMCPFIQNKMLFCIKYVSSCDCLIIILLFYVNQRLVLE